MVSAPPAREMASWLEREERARMEEEERVRALGALANLASNAANKQPMWQDAAVRAAIVAGAAAGQPEAVRVPALPRPQPGLAPPRPHRGGLPAGGGQRLRVLHAGGVMESCAVRPHRRVSYPEGWVAPHLSDLLAARPSVPQTCVCVMCTVSYLLPLRPGVLLAAFGLRGFCAHITKPKC